jgi:CheY-like chemotaxis protein
MRIKSLFADCADYDEDQKTNHWGDKGIRSKIILYSARMDRDLREQARALGVAACMDKPFELDEMREIVQRLLSTDYAD